MNLDLLDYVTGSISTDTFLGEPIIYSQRFYGRYPGHAPVFCLEYQQYTKCVVQIGAVYAIPVLRHYGDGGQACDW